MTAVVFALLGVVVGWLLRDRLRRDPAAPEATTPSTLLEPERERLLAALRESEARFRALADSGVIGVLVANSERILEANDAFLDLLGYTRDEMLAGQILLTEITPPEYADLDERALATLLRTGVCPPFEKEYIRKDGTRVPIVIGAAITEHEPLEWACFVIDVSERKRAEEDVRKFVALVENAGDVIGMTSLDWRLFYLNRAGRKLLGLPADAPIGDISLLELWDADTRIQIDRDVLPRLAVGEALTFDGRLQLAAREEPMDVECSAFGIRDAGTGRLLAQAFVFRDLTERKRVEEHLRQAQRMEAIGRVAGGVAHEVNNMMTVILGFCAFLTRSFEDAQDERAMDVGQIARAAERAADVSRQLLAYSRRQLLQPQLLELNAVLLGLEPVLRRLMGADRECVFRLSPHLGWVKADRTQFEQVILNLALNARDAMPHGGRFAVETSTEALSAEYAHRHPGIAIRPGPYAVVTVSDTGHGMDAATQQHIFEPFFTTKGVGKGTGLGLSTAYGIVKQSGGYIWVYSELGQGTTFKIYLPQVEESGERAAQVPATRVPRGRGEVILVVDDEELIRSFASRYLESEGYITRQCPDGATALELLAGQPGAADLVLLDAVMPRMSGREVAERLRAEFPDLPILFMSGYTNDEILRRGLLLPDVPFLQKPFTPEQLARMVRTALDARPGAPSAPAGTTPGPADATARGPDVDICGPPA